MKAEAYAVVALTHGLTQDVIEEYLKGEIPLDAEQLVDLRRGQDVLGAVLRAQEFSHEEEDG